MTSQTVQVPVSLLLDPALPYPVKLLWIALRLDPERAPTSLARRTGLSRPAIYKGFTLLAQVKRSYPGPRVKIPAALLAEPQVGARAKLLYGLLQAAPHKGQFTYPSLSQSTGLGPNTLKRAVKQLVDAGWLQVKQANRLSKMEFTLGSPQQFQSHEEVAAAQRRLNRATNVGEAIMHEYLSLLIDSQQFTENARPGFLVNPLTGERLELDRYYPPNLAFEFHGAQHYGASTRFSQAEAETQRLRDLIKAGLCLYEGINLILIHNADLSLQGMSAKVGQRLPLRNLADHEPLIELLERASLSYQAVAKAKRARERLG